MRVKLGTRGRVALLLTTTVLTGVFDPIVRADHVYAQTATERLHTFNIPPKPIRQALNDISRVTGISVVFSDGSAASVTANAVSGSLTREQALSRLLEGTGFSYSFTNGNTVTIRGRDVSGADISGDLGADGATVLNTIILRGSSTQGTVYSPYETAGATSHISSENIERFRGSSPSDIFRGTPGVLSGDSRNSAGGVDVNIRGLQGMGRVKVSVDDAENAVTVYHGYQGQSNRTYIDPDFIAGIDINKGLDVASRGAAGSVNMRTVSANDIVKDGEGWGIKVKGGFGTNTTSPTPGAIGGYRWPNVNRPALEESTSGMDQPSFLQPTSGSGSVVAAVKEDQWDFLAGYAVRKQGNYFAGSNGGEGVFADPVLSNGTIVNGGFTNYRRGEEVLNTELETHSWLAKTNFRFDDGQSLQLGYNGFRSEGGYFLPFFGAMADISQTAYGATTGMKIDTGTATYRYNPENNDLIDFKFGGWLTYFQILNEGRLLSTPGYIYPGAPWPADLGLAEDYRTGTNTMMWGLDVSNRSQFFFDQWGDLDLTYGLSYINQDVGIGRYADRMSFVAPSSGTRDEYGAFTKASYKPLDWLTLRGGLRYSRYEAEGPRKTIPDANGYPIISGPPGGASGFSPSAGVTIEHVDGVQIYANYSDALRLPSLMETIGTFTIVEADLKPERLQSYDVGVNLMKDGLLNGDDRAMLKFGWFQWNVKDYISRATQDIQSGTALRIHNIDSAKFSGLELSARYELDGFTAEASANYFTDVEYCVTASTCGNSSLYGDYATNHVPPEYTLDLKLSQKFWEDRLTVGGRVYHVGPRAADHGDVTSQGYSAFISQIQWKPYTLLDLFTEYKLTDAVTASLRVENVTDEFYVDPLGLLPQPGPGRTFYFGLTGHFGGNQPLPEWSPGLLNSGDGQPIDWTGFYAGAHGGPQFLSANGSMSVLDAAASTFGGKAAAIAASEGIDVDFNGGQIGFQTGYNWQFENKLVAGVELDWSKSWASTSQSHLALDDAAVAASGWLQSKTHHDIDWTASVRGKLGHAFDNGLMLYGTAGVAFLKERFGRDQYLILGQGYDSPAGSSNFVSRVDQKSAIRAGLTAGIGAEYAINDRWSIKADYTYSRFQSKDTEFRNALAGAGSDYLTRRQVGTNPLGQPIYQYTTNEGGAKTVNGRKASTALDFHAIKLGLNYRF
jgi:hemoglobin/transferrin/lactoferrin receptor protein